MDGRVSLAERGGVHEHVERFWNILTLFVRVGHNVCRFGGLCGTALGFGYSCSTLASSAVSFLFSGASVKVFFVLSFLLCLGYVLRNANSKEFGSFSPVKGNSVSVSVGKKDCHA